MTKQSNSNLEYMLFGLIWGIISTSWMFIAIFLGHEGPFDLTLAFPGLLKIIFFPAYIYLLLLDNFFTTLRVTSLFTTAFLFLIPLAIGILLSIGIKKIIKMVKQI